MAREFCDSRAIKSLAQFEEWKQDRNGNADSPPQVHFTDISKLIQCSDGEKPVMAMLLTYDHTYCLRRSVQLQGQLKEAYAEREENKPHLAKRKNDAEKVVDDAAEGDSSLGIMFSRGEIKKDSFEEQVQQWAQKFKWARKEIKAVEKINEATTARITSLEKEWAIYCDKICSFYREMLIRSGVCKENGQDIETTTELSEPETNPNAGEMSTPDIEENCNSFLSPCTPPDAEEIHLVKCCDIYHLTTLRYKEALIAHFGHRSGYKKALREYIQEQKKHRTGDFEAEFGPIWFLRGYEASQQVDQTLDALIDAIVEVKRIGIPAHFPSLSFLDDLEPQEEIVPEIERMRTRKKVEKWRNIGLIPDSHALNSVPESYQNEPAAPVPEELKRLLEVPTTKGPLLISTEHKNICDKNDTSGTDDNFSLCIHTSPTSKAHVGAAFNQQTPQNQTADKDEYQPGSNRQHAQVQKSKKRKRTDVEESRLEVSGGKKLDPCLDTFGNIPTPQRSADPKVRETSKRKHSDDEDEKDAIIRKKSRDSSSTPQSSKSQHLEDGEDKRAHRAPSPLTSFETSLKRKRINSVDDANPPKKARKTLIPTT
ncbi:hypothetical protein P280DRAFT_520127 [Massarina eburnea CBS 473.64]|uniref:Uncharacterized protein n=1 Tax=Massarina eburnea CBS 473.64 TaxID=1395130 RepID=A0A6A6RSV6_9PLEO|nr:hypothetical protein P280DRAFT_520127 [Massarina eburnea CBS 473.64]